MEQIETLYRAILDNKELFVALIVTVLAIVKLTAWGRAKADALEAVIGVIERGIHEELHRHADEINRLHSCVGAKLGTDTRWKIAGFALAIGGSVGGLIGFLMNLLMKVRP
jgi:hypothetical protein